MKSVTTERFRKAYESLPEQIKELTRRAYQKWKVNPNHPGLQFKQIHKVQAIYSVRISLSYRTLGVKQGNIMVWLFGFG